MKDIWKYLLEIKAISNENDCSSYIVGGVLRDLFIGKIIKDIDIVITKRVEEVARFFADKNNGSFFTLDEDRKVYRVVVNKKVFDFAQIIGESIENDLKQRDLTINAMAYPIDGIDILIKFLSKSDDFNRLNYINSLVDDSKDESILKKLFDPCGGLEDLSKGLLKISNKNVFKEDPLRIWRVFRIQRQLSFILAEETIIQLKEDNKLAATPAAERIKEEIMQLFNCDNISETISYMEEEFELFSILIPDISKMKETGENQHHQENAWQHCMQVLSTLEKILLEDKYLRLIDEHEIPLIKISAILHDIGKTESRSVKNGKIHYYGHEEKGADILAPILKKLKFSRKDKSFICNLVRNHMRPMLLYLADKLSDKGRYRFFRKLGDLAPVVLVHSLADKLAAMEVNDRKEEIIVYQKFIDDILDLYGEYKLRTANLLLSGSEVIDYFSLQEGPFVGKVLDKLAEAQALGKVKDKKAAIDYLDNYIKNKI
ncbi:HD domain-containing protein [Natronospora cellulosivora (SeqCode)]